MLWQVNKIFFWPEGQKKILFICSYPFPMLCPVLCRPNNVNAQVLGVLAVQDLVGKDRIL
jgi:sorbitol-specific phosphotransferase system component IIBC